MVSDSPTVISQFSIPDLTNGVVCVNYSVKDSHLQYFIRPYIIDFDFNKMHISKLESKNKPDS